MIKPKIIQTADGSTTLYVPELNEHFHSINGAITESMHVFIEAGLRKIPDSNEQLTILEIGFGTGLNALLTCLDPSTDKRIINYDAVEPFPVQDEILTQLNFSTLIQDERAQNIFAKLHESTWNAVNIITPNFILKKTNKKLEEISFENNHYDLVYFDAFAPDVQPELWTKEIFLKIKKATKKGGVLVTYSAKGQVRRNLEAAGFSVERLPGPPGKREMMRGVKSL